MTDMMSGAQHYIIGAGIAGLSAAVFLVRDAGVRGQNIHIFEKLSVTGGALDGSGNAEDGYLSRGGRMFEQNFVCTFDLLDAIPSPDDPGVSVTEDIMAFNRMVPGSSDCRLVRDGKPAPDRFRLNLRVRDIFDVKRLMLHPEPSLKDITIEGWFQPRFFDSNFWVMWSTMFAFQPWHSVVEMRRYLRRFIHLFPEFTRIAGILRTRFNQYDSIIVPLVNWLREHDVKIATDTDVTDLEIAGHRSERHVCEIVTGDGDRIAVRKADRVYMTLGSMTAGSTTGSNDTAPVLTYDAGDAWQLWRRLAGKHEGFGKPEKFCGDRIKTAWSSFTVTLDGPAFFEFMEDFTNNRTGTGGLVTFAESGWTLSVVMFHQPHFREQKEGTYTFWGYGLRGDRQGDFVKKRMWDATGDEIISEMAGHLRLNPEQQAWFRGCRVRPCMMPLITSQFMPRKPGDRPEIRPPGSINYAVMGQYCEQDADCVFTVEYSVRSAKSAVASLNNSVMPPPPVVRSDRNPVVLARAARVLLGL